MISLWLSIAALTLVTLLILLKPWIRPARAGSTSQAEANVAIYRGERDQLAADFSEGRITAEERDRALAEIEARILDDLAPAPAAPPQPARQRPGRPLWQAAAALAVVVPAAAVGLYAWLGNPSAPVAVATGADAAAMASGNGNRDENMARLADALAEKMQKAPDDAKGWTLLARTNHAIGRLDQAAQAYARAVALEPGDADLLADYADVLVQQSRGNFSGRPLELAKQALEIDPKNAKALVFMASAALTAGDREGSLKLWARVMEQLPPGSDDAKQVTAIMAQIRSGELTTAGATDGPPPSAGPASPAVKPPHPPKTGGGTGTAPATASAASPGAAITGAVTVKPELASKLAPGDALFIFARPADGGRMPIAVIRATARDLPYQFRLDDSVAMSGGPLLSTAGSVVVEARVSKSGEARAQPGDLFGRSQPVQPGATRVAVVIDATVP